MLPEKWIDRIFAHMSGLYGRKFADLWGDTDLPMIKALWAGKLAGFADNPDAIRAALESLDDKPYPPTLPEFLMMCREAAKRTGNPKTLQIERKFTEEEMKRNRERVAKITSEMFGGEKARERLEKMKREVGLR